MSRRPEGHFHPHFSQQVVERPAPAKRDGSVRPGLHGEASTSNIQLYMIYSWMHRLGETPKKLKFIYIYIIYYYILQLFCMETRSTSKILYLCLVMRRTVWCFFFFRFPVWRSQVKTSWSLRGCSRGDTWEWLGVGGRGWVGRPCAMWSMLWVFFFQFCSFT